MSWIFGKSDEQKKQESLNQQLGFDAALVSDVSSILGAPGALDTLKLHPLAGLEKGIEYLDLEEEKIKTVEGAQGVIPLRTWTEDLCYGTGTVYLLGLGLGGAYGAQEGLLNIPKGAPPKLQLNTVLNHITKRGPYLGNSAGVMALLYNLVVASVDSIREKHDDLNSIGAGAIAGALFRSSAGIRPMAYSTAMMSGAAAAWCGIKRLLA